MECDEAGIQVDAEENNRDSGWITVTRRRSEVNKAGGALGAQTAASKPTAEAPTPGSHGFEDIKKNILRASKMPPLPRDETKIVVRPRGGLCIERLARLSWQRPYGRRQDSIRARETRTRSITVAGQDHEVSAYVAAPHATCKGVIRGIPLSDGPEAIDQNQEYRVVIVLFDGYKVPNYVSYGGTLIKCTLYRKQVDVCYACGRVGHRSDVCMPDAPFVRRQTPHCIQDCKHRYQTPYVVRRRRGLRARATQARSPSFDVDATIELNGCHQQDQSDHRQLEADPDREGDPKPEAAAGAAPHPGVSKVLFEIRGTLQVQDTVRILDPYRPGYKYASGLQLSTAVQANEDQGRKKSNLTWADRVRSSDGEQPMQCDPPPEHARDAEPIRLPVPAGEGPMETKRRAVVSKLRNTESQVEEIKQTLVTITVNIKMVAETVASLTESVRQMQAVLSNPIEG
ncbi:hypothetical protein HPB52_000553 [Rhipicephalus sanguineus]|uniref:CCHC-type domain-containing protein n=1 Tax=Rhipicephalus sanguineus TaxID=34632 RepID=A0A9D4Q3J4_RHISA|nr:hypothetical protein HPB52_000553 [Rhipicephalus sanguineus]